MSSHCEDFIVRPPRRGADPEHQPPQPHGEPASNQGEDVVVRKPQPQTRLRRACDGSRLESEAIAVLLRVGARRGS